jgi:hypothetical protein
MIHHLRHALPALLITTTLALPARADNIDVSTIPGRDTVQLTIYNSEDLTLVRETRHVTFRKGLNPIQFSWANTLIDPTSVEIRFRTHERELDVLDATFPHDRPQLLYWNVQSAFDGDAVVEISYFTSGITWAADYVCVADTGEDRMSFEGFVRITNNSGEDYADAQVRLVVGEINLVEKVAELAQRGMITEAEKDAYFKRARKVRDFAEDARQELATFAGARLAAAEAAPKEIIKEGLSEYFIYTIEGTETVRHTWSKRMRLFESTATARRSTATSSSGCTSSATTPRAGSAARRCPSAPCRRAAACCRARSRCRCGGRTAGRAGRRTPAGGSGTSAPTRGTRCGRTSRSRAGTTTSRGPSASATTAIARSRSRCVAASTAT